MVRTVKSAILGEFKILLNLQSVYVCSHIRDTYV